MQGIRRALLATAAVVASTAPALAQSAVTTDSGTGSGSSLIFVWVWILVAGIIFMIVGTSIVGSQK